MQVQFKINGKNIADAAAITCAAWKFLHKWRWFGKCCNRMKVCSGGSRNLKSGARSWRDIIFEVLRLFWCPFTHFITYSMLLQWEYRIIYIFLTLHVDYKKINACYAVKIFKNKPLKIQTGVRAPGTPALDMPLVCFADWLMKLLWFCINQFDWIIRSSRWHH